MTVSRLRLARMPLDAMLEAELCLGDDTLPIGIGLPDFVLDQPYLRPGARLDMALAATALRCAPVETVVHTERLGQDSVNDLKRRGSWLGTDVQGLTYYWLRGVVAWLPGSERADVARFRATVLMVKAVEPTPEPAAWRLRVKVWQAGAADWVLDMFVPATCWARPCPPRAGEEVEGDAWLQGKCLGVG